MSKFLITNGSNFTPFTYDELVKPLMYAQEQHNAAQDVYDQLGMETDALERYITDNPDDAEARRLYDGYRTKLASLQQNLWDNGVTSQTRRDISAARNAYASDIARIQAAVKHRQEASKEWRDAKHKNPNLVTGRDPGLSGLDPYLRDDNYGGNWFSYDSAAFEAEVGAEVKARAQGMLRGIESGDSVYKNPALKGQLTRVLTKGVTNGEVTEAGGVLGDVLGLSAKAREDYYASNKISAVVQMLTETLIDKYEATGAPSAVLDDAERMRLINRGKAGWSYGVSAPEVKTFEDPDYAFEQQKRLLDYKAGLAKPRSGGANTDASGGYSFNSVILKLESSGAQELAKSLKGVMKHYDHDIPFTTADGQNTTVSDAWAMTEYVYNPDVRKNTRRDFGGLDIALPSDEKQKGRVVDRNGVTYEVETRELSNKDCDALGLPHGSVGIYYKGHLQKGYTENYNNAREQYEKHVADCIANNEGINLDDYAFSPKKEKELREKYGIDANVDSSDIESVLMTKERVGKYQPAMLVSTDSGDDYARDNFGRALIDSYNDKKNRLSKGSPYAFYKVSDGGISLSQEGETDGEKVLGKNPDPKTITKVFALPEDIAKGAGDGIPMLRFSTTASPGQWATSAESFGTQPYNVLKAQIYGEDVAQRLGVRTICDAVNYMMMPILHPEKMMAMSDEQAKEWSAGMYLLLNAGYNDDTFRGPAMYVGDRPVLLSGKEILRNGAYRAKLYGSISDYISAQMRATRDENSNNHGQWKGNSSTKSPDFE